MDTVTRRVFFTTSGAAAAGAVAVASGRQTANRALTLACANYVRLLPIATGDVRPHGIDLRWVRGERNEMLRRATEDPAVDGGETSMAQHVQRMDRGDRSLVAVPIFPLRNFTARDLYARLGTRIEPGSLTGRRVGIYNWAASGAVWYRHLLRHLGTDTKQVRWTVGGVDAPAAVRLPDPPVSSVAAAPAAATLSGLLKDGAIDALFAPLPPGGLDPMKGPIVRAVTDFQAVEERYFAETACYPPQHVIVLRRAAWERDPSVGRRLVEAFNASETAFEALQRQFPYNSPWLIGEVEHTARLMGPDYHAHGLEKNRKAVDTFCQGAFDDGLTKRRVTVDDFFAEFLKA